jgi:hypothetical protein
LQDRLLLDVWNVAQVSNLQYRRIPFGNRVKSKNNRVIGDLRIGNPRYSSLETCATFQIAPSSAGLNLMAVGNALKEFVHAKVHSP